MLVYELAKDLERIKSIDKELVYYNEFLGDTSFLLAGLLELLLKKNFGEWDSRKWIDDSLITRISTQNEKMNIEGIMIWGRENTTEQWTDPFSFEIELSMDEVSFKRFTFLFCDLDFREISYEEFKLNREYWDKNNRNWKYRINSDQSLTEAANGSI
jgi:hypothetical protein